MSEGSPYYDLRRLRRGVARGAREGGREAGRACSHADIIYMQHHECESARAGERAGASGRTKANLQSTKPSLLLSLPLSLSRTEKLQNAIGIGYCDYYLVTNIGY